MTRQITGLNSTLASPPKRGHAFLLCVLLLLFPHWPHDGDDDAFTRRVIAVNGMTMFSFLQVQTTMVVTFPSTGGLLEHIFVQQDKLLVFKFTSQRKSVKEEYQSVLT